MLQLTCVKHCVGRGESADQLYDDTWAFDMKSQRWLVVNLSLSLGVNETGDPLVPEGRMDPAGGVWDNLLWLSMGRNKDKRTLSDLWVLTLSTTEENGEVELVGESLSLSKTTVMFSRLPYFLGRLNPQIQLPCLRRTA